MATLEQRGASFRVIYHYSGERFTRSLKTKSERGARAALARLDDNLHRLGLGLITLPEGADLTTFLLSDGRAESKSSLPEIRTLREFIANYFDSIPAGAIEASTKQGMLTHQKHLERLLGHTFNVHGLEAGHLQSYIERRSKESGMHGRSLSAGTIKKEIVTLRTVWNWSLNMGFIKRSFPNRGLRYPKLHEKPPFQTCAEIERKIERGGLTKADISDLWDSAFLTLPEVAELLAQVKANDGLPFLYPMFVFAAHTGARRSEVLRSRIDDIDFAAKSVLVHEKKRVKGKLSTRRVPLSPLLCEVLRNWLDRHPGGLFTFCHEARVVRSKKQRAEIGPLTGDEAHDHFKRAVRHTKWKKLRGWHIFRHSFCSNCAARGIDQRVINAWVGHQTEEMVRRYRHLIPNQEQDAIFQVFGT